MLNNIFKSIGRGIKTTLSCIYFLLAALGLIVVIALYYPYFLGELSSAIDYWGVSSLLDDALFRIQHL